MSEYPETDSARGWVVAFAGCAINTWTFGVFYAFATALEQMLAEFDALHPRRSVTLGEELISRSLYRRLGARAENIPVVMLLTWCLASSATAQARITSQVVGQLVP